MKALNFFNHSTSILFKFVEAGCHSVIVTLPNSKRLALANNNNSALFVFLPRSMIMKPEQPGPQSYKPRTSSPIEFQFKWRNVRVNPQNIGADFPFHLELEQNRYAVRFLEFRSLTDPPFDIGNPGDIWLNVSSASYALFALNAKKEWLRWPGPTLAKDRMILHPYLPIYTLWCTIKQAGWYHGDKVGKDWIGEKLTARQELGGYSSMESMLDASVGVRLILLREEIERTKPFTEPVDPSATSLTSSIGDQLKSALDQMTSTSTLPEMQQALISTLSSGIDYCESS